MLKNEILAFVVTFLDMVLEDMVSGGGLVLGLGSLNGLFQP